MDSDTQTRSQFGAVIVNLATVFGASVGRTVLEGYWEALRDLSLDDVKIAAAKAARLLKWMPKPIELRDLAGDMMPEQRALQAWSAVRKAVASRGHRRSIDFDDPVINATVRMLGGWTELCETMTVDAEPFAAKRFQEQYVHCCRYGVRADQAAHLPGLEEKQNASWPQFNRPVAVKAGLPPHPEGVIRGDRLLPPDGGQGIGSLVKSMP